MVDLSLASGYSGCEKGSSVEYSTTYVCVSWTMRWLSSEQEELDSGVEREAKMWRESREQREGQRTSEE